MQISFEYYCCTYKTSFFCDSLTVEPAPGIVLTHEIGNCTVDMLCQSDMVCNAMDSAGLGVLSCQAECCEGDMCNKPTMPHTPSKSVDVY